jgi:hypothetical protein
MKSILMLMAVGGLAASAVAQDISQVNGYYTQTRVFNDFAGTSLLVNGNPEATPGVANTFATAGSGSMRFQEQFSAFEQGNFANKHLAYLSTDGGASALGLSHVQSWSIEMNISISAPGTGPRKEAGIRFENPRPSLGFVDEGLVLVASDGEVAVFGASMPFSGLGPIYTLNTTARLKFEFFAPGEIDAKGAYRVTFTDAVTGVHSTGIKIWGTESDGTAGFNYGTKVALVAQNQRNPLIADSSDINYSDIQIIPAPGAMALMGAAGLLAARRRR